MDAKTYLGKDNRQAVLRWKIVLWAYVGTVLVLFLVCVAFWVEGWRPESPRNMPPLGARAEQCQAAFGHPFDAGYDLEDLHRWSQGFYTKGWSIIVSYDDQRRAEQFIFCKTQLPMMRPPVMSVLEQKSLLEKFKEGSTWSPSPDPGTGPIWIRADGQAYVSYVIAPRWFVLMNRAGMDRSLKALNLQISDK